VRDFGVAIVPVDAEVAEAAAALQAGYARSGRRRDAPKLRTPDALILATATVYDEIDTVVGGDTKWMNVPGVDAEIILLREPS
jgi:predicted nucleic acid-binding protein